MKCSFCNKEVLKGTGKIFVRKDSKLLYFCSGKCEKNMLRLNRDPRKFKWTNSFIKGTIITKETKK